MNNLPIFKSVNKLKKPPERITILKGYSSATICGLVRLLWLYQTFCDGNLLHRGFKAGLKPQFAIVHTIWYPVLNTDEGIVFSHHCLELPLSL